jgi:hypothetical protein
MANTLSYYYTATITVVKSSLEQAPAAFNGLYWPVLYLVLMMHLKAARPNERYFTWVVTALLTNIRLGWKGLPGTKTLVYYKHSSIADVKKFYDIGRWLSSLPIGIMHRKDFHNFLFRMKRMKKELD